jgi:hypothetical protein
MAPSTTAPRFPKGTKLPQTEAVSEGSDDITIREEGLENSQDRRDEEDQECNRTEAYVDNLQTIGRQTQRGRTLVPPARFRDFTMEYYVYSVNQLLSF